MGRWTKKWCNKLKIANYIPSIDKLNRTIYPHARSKIAYSEDELDSDTKTRKY
jgi:hypothetical protein